MNLELVALTLIQKLCRVEGGGGADDKFVTLYVKKGYGLVSTRSQLYRARPAISWFSTGSPIYYSHMTSHNFAALWQEKMTKNKIQNSIHIRAYLQKCNTNEIIVY